jgi:hypothetical protein
VQWREEARKTRIGNRGTGFERKGYIRAVVLRHRNPSGAWTWNLSGVRRVIYCLPEVIRANFVLICEGEKDCDTARTLELAAHAHGFDLATPFEKFSKWVVSAI